MPLCSRSSCSAAWPQLWCPEIFSTLPPTCAGHCAFALYRRKRCGRHHLLHPYRKCSRGRLYPSKTENIRACWAVANHTVLLNESCLHLFDEIFCPSSPRFAMPATTLLPSPFLEYIDLCSAGFKIIRVADATGKAPRLCTCQISKPYRRRHLTELISK